MSIKQTAGRNQLGEFAPDFAHFNDDVLFGENWNNKDIDMKTRCIITVVALMSSGITDASLRYHLENAKKNGVTREEIAAIITHTAFYVGWPKGWTVFNQAKEVWNENTPADDAKAKHAADMVFPIGAPNDTYAQYFVGQSYLAPLSTEQVEIYNVTFEPGCRNNWHIHHNAAQVLIAVGGRGYYQIEGQEPKELKAGQAVCIPADTKHWHGAAPGESCSHLAFMVPAGDPASMSNEWLEPVDAEAYGKLA